MKTHNSSSILSNSMAINTVNSRFIKSGLLFIFLIIHSILFAQFTEIPDVDFEQALINKGIDSNPVPDGQILTSDANNFSGVLTLFNEGINDLTGIESFVNIHTLNLAANYIYSVDLTGLQSLEHLAISSNGTNEINFSSLTNLKTFTANFTPLGQIDISGLTNLTSFVCSPCNIYYLTIGALPLLEVLGVSWNGLQSLDLSGVNNLRELYIDENLFEELALSNLTNLEKLVCGNNKFESIDLSNLSDLEILKIRYNDLITLDVSMLQNLTELNCEGNELKSLYLRNGSNTSITDFKATNNVNLYCISVDDATWANANWSNFIDPIASFTEDEFCDTDGDFVYDEDDNCPLSGNSEQIDTDGDGLGNVCDDDDDNDGILDNVDNCFLVVNPDQADNDGDNIGDICDVDDDNDGVSDSSDNCPLLANSNQSDIDGDLIGDVCDEDDDNDGVLDIVDNCPLTNNPDQLNNDGDLLGDVCDEDDDNDGIFDNMDNCPLLANSDQSDNDSDNMGDICDPDDDNDGILDGLDNCPLIENANQSDLDLDDIGDVCDLTMSTAGVVDNLSTIIIDLNLPHGLENSLLSTLESALESCENGNPTAAINKLEAFINKVEAQKGKKIDAEDADILIFIAQALIDAIVNGTSDCSETNGLIIPQSTNAIPASTFLYPNPVQNSLYLHGVPKNASIEILNCSGKRVLKTTFSGEYLQLSHIEDGIYYIQIVSGKSSIHRLERFIKITN